MCVEPTVDLARAWCVWCLDLDLRLLLLVRRIDDVQARETRDFVDFLVDRDALEDVLETNLTCFLGQNREGVRIPLDQNLSLLDRLPFLHLEPRAVHNRIAF